MQSDASLLYKVKWETSGIKTILSVAYLLIIIYQKSFEHFKIPTCKQILYVVSLSVHILWAPLTIGVL